MKYHIDMGTYVYRKELYTHVVPVRICLYFGAHGIRILCKLDGQFPVDLPLKIELDNCLIHSDHA